MSRHRWSLALLVPLICGLGPGCVVFGGLSVQQADVIGDVSWTITPCASGVVPGSCADTGTSTRVAQPGPGQVLVGVRASSRVPLPDTLTSTAPAVLGFSRSPSYTSELERLAPAKAGTRWQGYISEVFTYATNGPQRITLTIPEPLAADADGSPASGLVETEIVLGGRMVTTDLPGGRPVACGTALGTALDEDPSDTFVYGICRDAGTATATVTLRGAGILSGAARVSTAPGTVAGVPFTLRYTGPPDAAVNFTLAATSTLPGSVVAVTPGTLQPAGPGDTPLLVAVGVPSDAPAGTYGVTLTASLANGQVRTGTGTVTVVRPAVAVAKPSTAARITAALPRRITARAARRSGIAVQIGATTPRTVRVLLFQGRGRAAKAARTVALRVPGPTRVVLRSRLLAKGPYRVVIRLGGRDIIRRGVLLR